ncbi:MAG: hypothetical protein NC218_06665 [Acetobacter sp.]|nr:hypothetical protein [Acetobacter sp.]
MIELGEEFSKNDRYLVDEYLQYGTDDFLFVGVGDKSFVVPYKYRVGAKDETAAVEQFKEALLDFQNNDIRQYQKAGLPVRRVSYERTQYVVPFEARDAVNVSPKKVADYVSGLAQKKYDLIINAHRYLKNGGIGLGDVDMSSAAYKKYSHYLNLHCEQERKQGLRVQSVAQKAKGQKSKQFNISAEEIAIQAGRLAEKAWNTVKEYPKTSGAAAFLIGMTMLGGHLQPRGCSSDEPWEEVPIEDIVDTTSYTDFMGTKHSDSLGNIARIMNMKAEISAMLIAVEGYADEAYPDGKKVPTIGSGTTFYIDENGKETKVTLTDVTTPEKAMRDKWRYIEAKMLPLLGDCIGRSCSNEELMACIGAGFCWGKDAFKDSSFYKSVCAGESLEQQKRKLTGFRKQKGLLKRSYVLAACLTGDWTAKDLLEMPIYKYKDYGYLNSAIYRLALSDIMPCKKDKNGKFLRDKDGNQIPVVEKDGFCSFYDNTAEIKKKIQYQAELSKAQKKRVRDFMPDEMIQSINLQFNSEAFNLALQEHQRGGR